MYVASHNLLRFLKNCSKFSVLSFSFSVLDFMTYVYDVIYNKIIREAMNRIQFVLYISIRQCILMNN